MSQVEHDRRIDYIEFPATNIADAKRFYSSAFGWEFTFRCFIVRVQASSARQYVTERNFALTSIRRVENGESCVWWFYQWIQNEILSGTFWRRWRIAPRKRCGALQENSAISELR